MYNLTWLNFVHSTNTPKHRHTHTQNIISNTDVTLGIDEIVQFLSDISHGVQELNFPT